MTPAKDTNMPAARLKQRVTIEQQSLAPDGLGGAARGWATLATVWAEVMPVSGREALFAFRLESPVTHRVTIRYRTDVKADMRLNYESRILTIRAVINRGEENRYLEILAEEGVAS